MLGMYIKFITWDQSPVGLDKDFFLTENDNKVNSNKPFIKNGGWKVNN